MGVKLTKDWERLQRQLSEEVFRAKVTDEMKRATRVNAAIVKREMRLQLRDGSHSANDSLTRFIKGSSKPLADTAQLMRSHAFRTITPFRAEIGILKKTPAANVAMIVHEGAMIRVTPRMRGMFAALQDVSEGKRDPGRLRGRARELFERRQKGWRALKPSTTVIRIPPRRWMLQTIQRRDLNTALGKNWLAAAAAAIAGTRAKLKTEV